VISGIPGARFWAVDLHTHTPASRDVQTKTYGATTAEEVVQAALDAHLDAIGITDHNTSSWCDQVANAAKGTGLIVLPGLEISTTEGHLLAIWEEGTPGSTIDEVLVRLGINKVDQGKLDIAATVGFADAAREVTKANGIAIAAHIDRPKGLLQLSVAAHVKRTLLDDALCAVEVVDMATVVTVARKVGDKRTLACVRGSDVTLPGKSLHTVSGIGSRRTWVKAARADLIGIKHALNDPDLRIRLEDPNATTPHPCIESVTISGEFMEETVVLSPDLNCLLGGTGAGKSLVLESIRYALDQQVNGNTFSHIKDEVDSRLQFGLGRTGVVRVVVSVDGNRYLIERPYADDGSALPKVHQEAEGEWTDIAILPQEIISIAAFSQGEILEFSRQPVGRMNLLDSAIDFGDLFERERVALSSLQTNASYLLDQRKLVKALKAETLKEHDVNERVNELSALFDKDVVKQQEGWKKESQRLSRAQQSLPKMNETIFNVPKVATLSEIPANKDLFDQVEVIRKSLQDSILEGLENIRGAIQTANSSISGIKSTWDVRFDVFKNKLNTELESVKEGASLVILRSQLEQLQGQLMDIQSKRNDLEQVEAPRLQELVDERDGLLEELQNIRDERRKLRRARATKLNTKTAKIVKVDVSAHPDKIAFRDALDKLKTGSRVTGDVLEAIANHIHPFRFARSMLDSDLQSLINVQAGIDLNSLARLLTNLDDKDLWAEMLVAQTCEMPDRLDMKFRKPEDGTYAAIEQLAHGQRCTAILVVLLADGVDPVIVDQPEDALHAPWIEDYLVDRLRELRGERQYIFATRSPGIVVGGDAEQIVTMKATAGKGEIEATGSLERHDLNKLALHHLEGGPIAFKRRSGKLRISVNP
jgi:hypothetical protein